MSQHKESMSQQKFTIACKLGQFFVATDEKFVTTSNIMFKFTYVSIETVFAISESNVDYVATHRKYVETQKFDARVNLCRDIQKYFRDDVFLF